MKYIFAGIFLIFMIGFSSAMVNGNACLSKSPRFHDNFENYPIGSDASCVWDTGYSYSDDFSEGGAEVIRDGSQVLEVNRAYLWHNTFSRLFLSRIKITQSSNDYEWYGSRVALVNRNNPLEKYEIRLYPNTNRLQVNYVDRTNRTGVMSEDNENTISEILDSTDCNINLNKWYYVFVVRKGTKWKAYLFNWMRPTCKVTWEDNRITGRPAIGIQSAGKYVTSRFDNIFSK
jgi:asparagine N-glycosylation enzyme membrane subunit Stt3